MSAIGPFPQPTEGSKPAAPPTLTDEQQTKYDELLSEVRSWESLPKSSAKGAETAPLADHERMWLTRECILRYLRATKWNLPQSSKRLQDTLIWRREYGTDNFTADYISDENKTGKQVILGFDKEGRPCLYLLPQNQNTKTSPKQVEHLVFMLERTLDIAPPGQETLALLIDFRNSSAGSQPSVATGRQVLHILQNHYPERLGRALLTHLPWYVTTFLKLVSPFIDPVTKTKIKYNEPLTDHVPASQLMTVSGGEVDFKYDHEVYWPALNELAEQRRKERKERWHAAGGIIGESEVYIWGGEEPSLAKKDKEPTTEVPKEGATNGATETKEQVIVPEKKDGETELSNGVAKLDVKDNGEAKQPEVGEVKKDTEEVKKTEA